MRGAIDPHMHSGPANVARSLDHIEAMQEASQCGYAAIVFKDHHYDVSPTARLLARHFPQFTTKVFSGIVLNSTVGGMNPLAVEHCAAHGGKIVWMPTLSAENHNRWALTHNHPAASASMRAPAEVPVTIDRRVVRDDAKAVLDVIAAKNLILATGHLHVEEVWRVTDEARRRGVKQIIVTHPEDIVDASMNDVGGLAAAGCYIEHSLAGFVEGSSLRGHTYDDLKLWIDAGTVDRTILCSDLGAAGTIRPVEGFRRAIKGCIDLGYSDDEIRRLFSQNAAAMLGVNVLHN